MNSSDKHATQTFFSKRFWIIAAALWTAAVLALAVSPNMQSSWLMKTLGDKILHGLAFTIGAIAWTKAFEAFRIWRIGIAMVVGALAALAVGVAIELIQSYVPRRSSDVQDFLADVLGVLAAMVIIALWHWIRVKVRLSNG